MADLLQWWNLIYVLAFFFALLYALLNAVGLASGAHADVDHDVGDLDVDHDFEAHVDVDHDVGDLGMDHDIEADMDVDHDVGDLGADHDVDGHVHVGHDVDVHAHPDLVHDAQVGTAQGEPSFLEEALSFFGIGKVPLSVVLMTFLITFAVVGWGVNAALQPLVRTPLVFFPISCAAAAFCGLFGTKLLASTLGRYLRPVDTAALPRSALVGRIATASLPVTEKFGQALVRDPHGTLHKVVCKVPEGAAAIPKGRTILLVRYVPVHEAGRRSSGYYLVEPYDVPNHA